MRLAVRILGGEEPACHVLGASAAELQDWLSGEAEPPAQMLGRALQAILADPAATAREALFLAAEDNQLGARKNIRT